MREASPNTKLGWLTNDGLSGQVESFLVEMQLVLAFAHNPAQVKGMVTQSKDKLSIAEAELRARLAQIEDIKKKREDLAKAEADFLRTLESAPSPSLLASKAARRKSNEPKKKRQKDWIEEILRDKGPIGRDDLFAALQPTGKAPADVNQLSALLSRGKRENRMVVDSNYRWSLAPGVTLEGDEIKDYL